MGAVHPSISWRTHQRGSFGVSENSLPFRESSIIGTEAVELGLVTKHLAVLHIITTQRVHRDVAVVIFTDVPERKFRKV